MNGQILDCSIGQTTAAHSTAGQTQCGLLDCLLARRMPSGGRGEIILIQAGDNACAKHDAGSPATNYNAAAGERGYHNNTNDYSTGHTTTQPTGMLGSVT